MTRDELALETEHLDLLECLAAAKASGDRDQLATAKAAIRGFREKWRTIRAEFNPVPAPGDGVAIPETVTRTAHTPKVGG